MLRIAAAVALSLGLVACAYGPEGDGATLGAAGKCACGGAKCGCIKPLCGGVRECGCAAMKVDCQCPAKLCKSAGTYACCSGTHQVKDKQRCNTTCACTATKGACACSSSCACSWRNR